MCVCVCVSVYVCVQTDARTAANTTRLQSGHFRGQILEVRVRPPKERGSTPEPRLTGHLPVQGHTRRLDTKITRRRLWMWPGNGATSASPRRPHLGVVRLCPLNRPHP